MATRGARGKRRWIVPRYVSGPYQIPTLSRLPVSRIAHNISAVWRPDYARLFGPNPTTVCSYQSLRPRYEVHPHSPTLTTDLFWFTLTDWHDAQSINRVPELGDAPFAVAESSRRGEKTREGRIRRRRQYRNLAVGLVRMGS